MKKLLLTNSAMNLLFQVTTIVCGLIVPRLILGAFGSEVNGLISSITQFLSYIALLEAGVGGVVKAALYRPLVEKDYLELSAVLKATDRFFKVIAYIFIVYIAVLSVIYPKIVNTSFSHLYTASLIIIISISSFAQYYFGMTYQLLLQADQKLWLTSFTNIATLVLNTIVTYILVSLGFGIHAVKIGSAIIYVLRPITYNIYVHKKYPLVSTCEEKKEAIKQRWDGLGHHIAYYIHSNTDMVVLSIFLGNTEVSVYAVYFLVVNGIRSLVNSAVSAFEAFFGNLLVNGSRSELNKALDVYELVNYVIITIMFSTTIVMIVPFVKLYTAGITDANYIRPTFSLILVLSEAAYCVRNPYSAAIFAAGKFKETRNGAFVEAAVNIVLSLLLVNLMGIVGVAIGTLVAMLLRSIQYIVFLSSNIVYRPVYKSIRKLLVTTACIFIIIMIMSSIGINANNIISWCLYGFITFIIACGVTGLIFLLTCKSDVQIMIEMFNDIRLRRKQR